MTGRVAMETRLGNKKGQVVLDVRNLKAAVYFVELAEPGSVPALTEKLIIE